MLWLYWRQVRVVAGGIAAALAVVSGFVLAVALVGGSGRAPAHRHGHLPAVSPLRRYSAEHATAADIHRGLTLMGAAAVACQTISYRGIQMVAWSTAGGSDAYLIDVWHRSGQPELAAGDDDVDDQVPGTKANGDAVIGVLSISARMLDLLRANYLIEYAGTGSSSDRPAAIVAVRRHDGTLAARYWLDQVTGLPLRREMFDARGNLVNEGAFIDLQFGDRGVGLVPGVRTPAWRAQPGTTGLALLRSDGWAVPHSVGSNLALIGITKTATATGPIVDASYSDGLSVVSVFIQRGTLPGALPGWRPAEVSGQPVYLTESSGLGERGLAWSARGFVYTVIADAPQQTITSVVAQLPHDHRTGLESGGVWGRVGRGLQRIASWFNPFG